MDNKIKAVEHSADVVTYQMRIWELYDSFGRKGYERIKLVGWPHKDAESCAKSINAFMKRNHIRTIKARVKRGEVFVEKVDM